MTSTAMKTRSRPSASVQVTNPLALEPPSYCGLDTIILGGGRYLIGTSSECAIRLQADPAMQCGDCRAESGDVSIAYHLKDQLAEIRDHLLQGLEGAEIERRRTPPADKVLRRFPDRRATA